MGDRGPEFATKWGRSGIYCPECAGDCLTDGQTLTCVECPFKTTARSATGRRLIRQYTDATGGDDS